MTGMSEIAPEADISRHDKIDVIDPQPTWRPRSLASVNIPESDQSAALIACTYKACVS
jgi:hypothetical protein